MNLKGKTAVIFGGNGIIGSNLIEKFFSHDIDIIYTSYYEKKDKILKLEKKFKNRLFYSQIDIKDPKEVQIFLDDIKKINIGVNCVGIVDDHSISNLTYKSWNNVIETNLTGTFNTSKSLFSKMKKVGNGKIVNISSIVALNGSFGQVNYSASKAGIIGLTKSLSMEGAKHNIMVNCVIPGYIESKMAEKIPKNVLQEFIKKIPLKRLGVPDNVSDSILFLSSDYANYITGETICVSGGL